MRCAATDGKLHERCLVIIANACRRAAGDFSRSGRGRPPRVPDWVLAAVVVLGTLRRKKTRVAQHALWLTQQRAWAKSLAGTRPLGRSQFYQRVRRLGPLLEIVLQRCGAEAVRRGWADAEVVAIDKSVIAARGRCRSARRRRRASDPDATWTYSEHDGWTFGYAYEVVVSAGKHGIEWPLLASVSTASCSEQRSSLDKFDQLPPATRYVLADAGYDSNRVAERVEWTATGEATGRRFLCPEIPRPNVGRPRQVTSRETRARQHHRRLRDARRRYFQSARGRRLYRRRKTTVEPFNSRFKHAFELHDRVWHWRLINNRVSLLAAIIAYQTLLAYNHHRGLRSASIQSMLNTL
jgi:hypothetical protein